MYQFMVGIERDTSEEPRMANELKLLALHAHKDSNGDWYVVATVETKNGPSTRTFFESKLRPIFDTESGLLTWEKKIE